METEQGGSGSSRQVTAQAAGEFLATIWRELLDWGAIAPNSAGRLLTAVLNLVMLAIAVMLFFPVLSAGSIFGQPVHGNVSPVGVSLLFGAFIFGIGMQIGGGCASGTLYTVGGRRTGPPPGSRNHRRLPGA